MFQTFASFRAAWAVQDASPLRWLQLGDSITEGSAVTDMRQSWSMVAAQALRAAFSCPENATQPVGYLPIVNTSSRVLPWAVTGAVAYTTHGLRRDHCVYMTETGSKITGTVTGTHLRIWYVAGATTTSPVVKIDGITQDPFTTPAANPTVPSSRMSYILGESGPHTVEIVKGAGPCYIEGVEVFDGNRCAGLQVLNAARSGWGAAQFAAVSGNTPDGRAFGNGAAWRAALTKANPHLVTIVLGMNDFTATADPAAYAANLETIVGWLRSTGEVWPSIVLMMPHKRNTVGLAGRLPWERYEHGLEILAARLGCGFLDLRRHMPDADASGSGFYSTDGIHPNVSGHAEIGRIVSDYLTAQVATP